MPSTYTTNLALEKQATGENSGTWGTLLNAVLDQLDKAVAGYLSKSVAGASDVTLTATEALDNTQEYTGTLTGNINVIVPTLERTYWVYNNTGGAFTLTVKTAAGTGIAVTQGTKAFLYCEGTNVIKMFALADYTAGAIANVVEDTTPQLGGFLDANGNYIQMEKGGDIASASPLVIDTDGDFFDVTGTTGFAAMTVAADRHFFLHFDGVLTLTHHATNLDLPGEQNFTTAAGDVLEFLSTGSNTVQCVNISQAGARNYQDRILQRPVLKDYGETVVAKGNFGATPAWDVSSGNYQWGTADQEVTSSTMTNWPASGTLGSLTLEVINGAAAAFVWPTSVDWEDGSAPTMTASGTDFLVFWSRDGGTTVHGALSSLDSK